MIEIGEIEGEYKLFIDGMLIDEVDILDYSDKDNKSYGLTISDLEVGNKITSYALTEFPSIDNLTYNCDLNWLGIMGYTRIDYNSKDQLFKAVILLTKLSRWRRQYSFHDYFMELRKLYEASGKQDIELGTAEDGVYYPPMDGFMIQFSCSAEQPIAVEVNRHLETLRKYHDEVDSNLKLLSHSKDNSITVTFDFPEEIKVSCEQYLLYFAQFLKDLGVEATTELQDQAGQVLFSVTPADQNTALDKIRLALETYLQLPASKLVSEDQDIVVQRLSANIYHLKGQLALTQAMLQTKDATIEAKQLTIDVQRSLLSGEIVFDSMKDVTPKPETKEELLGGIVSLATYKDKGIEVNLAEIYRKLKALFKDKG